MENLSVLLNIFEGDVFFDVSQNKLLKKQLSCWWFEKPCDISAMKLLSETALSNLIRTVNGGEGLRN